MKKYVVYEIWTRSRVIEAEDDGAAYNKGQPQPRKDKLSLSNWHIQAVEEKEPTK